MSNSFIALSRQVIRPNRLQAWVFVVGCGLSSMLSAGATALFMTPEPIRVLIPQQAAITHCHDMITTTVIPRAEILDALSSETEMAQQVRLVPAFQDGQAVGIRIFAIDPGSVYETIGLENGDTIVSVNGVSVLSRDREWLLWQLVEAENLRIALSRRGCARTLDVGLR